MLPPPSHAVCPGRMIAGIGARYRHGDSAHAGIQAQWREAAPHFGALTAASGDDGFGVNYAFDDTGGFSYLAAMEVRHSGALPKAFETLRLEACNCAVFQHSGHVSAIPASMRAIWDVWAPGEGLEPAGSPCFEVYGERFDGALGTGEVEIWVPVKPGRSQ